MVDIVEEYRRLVKGRGCSDGNCCFEKPKGMHTNGGCQCSNKRTAHEFNLRALGRVGIYAQKMADEIERLRAELDKQKWFKTTDRLPEKPGLKSYEYVDCLILHKGEIKMRPWNCEHLVWDDEHYDDFFCEPTEPTYWRLLPKGPDDE